MNHTKTFLFILLLSDIILSCEKQSKNTNDMLNVSVCDYKTQYYVLVTAGNGILFIDISTGEIKDSYETDFEI
jgi:hypothetical protein